MSRQPLPTKRFAVRAEDTYGATESEPVLLQLNSETIPTGVAPSQEVLSGTATPIATGGMLPRGADAVLPVEFTDVQGNAIVARRERVPGAADTASAWKVAANQVSCRGAITARFHRDGWTARCVLDL